MHKELYIFSFVRHISHLYFNNKFWSDEMEDLIQVLKAMVVLNI